MDALSDQIRIWWRNDKRDILIHTIIMCLDWFSLMSPHVSELNGAERTVYG